MQRVSIIARWINQSPVLCASAVPLTLRVFVCGMIVEVHLWVIRVHFQWVRCHLGLSFHSGWVLSIVHEVFAVQEISIYAVITFIIWLVQEHWWPLHHQPNIDFHHVRCERTHRHQIQIVLATHLCVDLLQSFCLVLVVDVLAFFHERLIIQLHLFFHSI